MIISLVNQKGGVGKTTIAINLAYCLGVKTDKGVLLVDGDPQGSIIRWAGINDNHSFDVIHHPEATLHENMGGLAREYKHVIIDTPPAITSVIRSALVVTDLVIIPIQPSPLDIWAGQKTINLVKQAKQHNRKLSARLLICKKIVGTRIASEARDTLTVYKVKTFKTEISQRVAFIESMTAGLSVIAYDPKSEASVEIKNLYKEVVRQGG